MTLGPTPPGAAVPAVPGWLGPIVSVTTTLGVPTVFAGVLLWFVLTHVGGTLEHMQEEEETRTRIVAAMQDTMIAAFDRQTAQFVAAINQNIEVNKMLADRYERRHEHDAP
jgi:hypothetical protein